MSSETLEEGEEWTQGELQHIKVNLSFYLTHLFALLSVVSMNPTMVPQLALKLVYRLHNNKIYKKYKIIIKI